VPVIDIRRAPDGIAHIELDDLPVAGPGEGDPRGHDHVLARRMQVPCGPGTGLKGDVGTGVMSGGIVRKEHLHLNLSGEVCFRPLERLLRTASIQGLLGRFIRRQSGLAENPAEKTQQP